MPPPITLCGSLSRLASPLGRAMHEAGYRALGVPFTYVPFEVRDLAGALAGMRSLGIRGFGVSHPFKQEVIQLLDALDPVAAHIGAVNTIVNDGGRLVGHNTDWIGAVSALEEVRSLAGSTVLLLGAGGAARAIAFGLAQKGARTTIANRDGARAALLASAVGGSTKTLEWHEAGAAAARPNGFDIVVNATAAGQSDVSSASPLPPDAFRSGQIVMDIVYKPVRTALLGDAKRGGATVVHGGRMLLHQAAAQFEAYVGARAASERPALLAAMDAALTAALS
jgi:shikimate dehydrogenase